jgi:hypothetical protein
MDIRKWWTSVQIGALWSVILLQSRLAVGLYAQLFRLQPQPIRWEDGYDV